jgi:hypothetical protein
METMTHKQEQEIMRAVFVQTERSKKALNGLNTLTGALHLCNSAVVKGPVSQACWKLKEAIQLLEEAREEQVTILEQTKVRELQEAQRATDTP